MLVKTKEDGRDLFGMISNDFDCKVLSLGAVGKEYGGRKREREREREREEGAQAHFIPGFMEESMNI